MGSLKVLVVVAVIAALLVPAQAKVVPGVYVVGFKVKDKGCKMMEANVLSAMKASGCRCRMLKMSKKLHFAVIKTNASLTQVKKALGSLGVSYVEPAHYVYATYIPNDPYFPKQWGLKDINATKAWNLTTNSSIIVAVVDTGVDYTHPDIAAHYIGGYDIVNDDPNPLDDNGHGTHCAGIIAAVIDNSIGVAGVANVKILAEKVLDSSGVGTDYNVALGIQYAVDNGSKVISLSLGSSTSSSVIESAVQYAWSKGAIIVAASGNDGNSSVDYPAAYPQVIAVGAINSSDKLASFSNYGANQELVAPGVNILSTFPTYPVYLNTTYGYPLDYAYLSGTSMATPFVAGVAALTWATHPNATNAQIRYILNHTAIDLGTPGWDPVYGYGKVDAYRAITYGIQVYPNGYSDRAVDVNGDGVYDYLVINMSIYTVVPANYTIYANLVENTTVVYSFNKSVYLLAGEDHVTLEVPGSVIASTGYNGSYKLENLRIYNATSLVYSKALAYTTSSYNYTDFLNSTPVPTPTPTPTPTPVPTPTPTPTPTPVPTPTPTPVPTPTPTPTPTPIVTPTPTPTPIPTLTPTPTPTPTPPWPWWHWRHWHWWKFWFNW